MTDAALRQALAYARRGWPVFPCQPGQKIPATRHGYKDATTDPEQITGWFGRHPDWNVAIATGAPGPDVLDVDQHGLAGNGYTALGRLRRAGLLDGAAAYVRTPSGGLHAYFTGTARTHIRRLRHDGSTYAGIATAAGLAPATVSGLAVGRRRPTRGITAAVLAVTSGTGPDPARPPAGTWTPWPAGSPASPRATATPACTGPPTAPWKPTRPPT